eukprot:5110050-Prymnesium_polylepis.1
MSRGVRVIHVSRALACPTLLRRTNFFVLARVPPPSPSSTGGVMRVPRGRVVCVDIHIIPPYTDRDTVPPEPQFKPSNTVLATPNVVHW